MRINVLKSGLLGMAVFVIVGTVPLSVSAVTDSEKTTTTSGRESDESHEQKRQTLVENKSLLAEEHKDAARAKLADAKLRICQNREESIKNIISRLKDRGTKHFEVFNKISERTQAFYVQKGKVLSNYDELVAQVNAQKANVVATIAQVKDSDVNFSCEGTDPKGVADTFKSKLVSVHEALKSYRTAIKNLIVGVKSVQSQQGDRDAQE